MPPRIFQLLNAVRTVVQPKRLHVRVHVKCTTLFVLSVDKIAKFPSSLAQRKRAASQYSVAIVSQQNAGNFI
jgi:hypothetical protein